MNSEHTMNQLPRLLAACTMAVLLGCANSGSSPGATSYSTMERTNLVGRENVPMQDTEVKRHQQQKPSAAPRQTASRTSTTSRTQVQNTQESITTSTTTERVIEVVPVAAPNSEVILQ